ncbi:MAG TPA: ribulokinase [Acidimicrobiales bacterium]|nr:ribulokinase [Acidimicrobiales bacterium]
MERPPCAIGIDFGTASARTLLLDLESGDELSVAEISYEHGVIDEILPGAQVRLPLDWALHDPDDYLATLQKGIARVLQDAPGAASSVIGIGVDATSCTVLPASADGAPLTRSALRNRPHAWAKLWKHHAAQPVADRLNEVAAARSEAWLSRYGGRISSEWYFPKLIEIWLEDKEVYEAADRFVEVVDWVVWQLTGTERRSACPAAYKALWAEEGGVPSAEFFEAAYPGFRAPWDKLGKDFYPLGTNAGHLRPELAARLGLPESVVVAVGNVDSFVSFPGAGAEGADEFVMVVGTSICDLVVRDAEILLEGITGVAKDGIVPGLFGYEAGQPAVGDMLGWFATRMLGGEAGTTLPALEAAAAALAPAATGLVALDWWNGNRSVLADADLSGVIAGLNLQSTAADIYRCLLESIAFGNHEIIGNFRRAGFSFGEIVACGGIAERSPLLMQLLADVSGLPVRVPGSSQVPARGSALFGAVAAGPGRGGFAEIAAAARTLRPPTAQRYRPRPEATATYARVYAIWRNLHENLGRGHADWLHGLKTLKRAAEAQA